MRNDSLSAKDWLEKACEDIKVAEYLCNTSEFYADVCFHAQQSAEKSLKAFLIYHREVSRKVHLLKVLPQDCIKYDSTLENIVGHLEFLDKLYIPTRYPFKVEFNQEKVKKSIEFAKTILETIKSKIK